MKVIHHIDSVALKIITPSLVPVNISVRGHYGGLLGATCQQVLAVESAAAATTVFQLRTTEQ